MVSCCDLVVAVCLNALDGVVGVVIELVQHHLIKFIVDWHRLLTWKQSVRSFVLHLLEPCVTPDIIDPVTFFWVSIQNFCKEMSAVLR